MMKLVKEGGKTLLRSLNREYPDIAVENGNGITGVAALHKVLNS